MDFSDNSSVQCKKAVTDTLNTNIYGHFALIVFDTQPGIIFLQCINLSAAMNVV